MSQLDRLTPVGTTTSMSLGPKAVLDQQMFDDSLRRWKVRRDNLGTAGGRIAVVTARELGEPEPLLLATSTRDDHRTRRIADDVVEDLARRAVGQDVHAHTQCVPASWLGQQQ